VGVALQKESRLVEQTEADKETEACEHDGQYQKQGADQSEYGKGFPSVELHLAIVPDGVLALLSVLRVLERQ
jgi:hypothetical protein